MSYSSNCIKSILPQVRHHGGERAGGGAVLHDAQPRAERPGLSLLQDGPQPHLHSPQPLVLQGPHSEPAALLRHGAGRRAGQRAHALHRGQDRAAGLGPDSGQLAQPALPTRPEEDNEAGLCSKPMEPPPPPPQEKG